MQITIAPLNISKINMSSKTDKQLIINWIQNNLSILPNQNCHPSNGNGTNPKYWPRRGKAIIGGVIYRAYEAPTYCSKIFPQEYVVIGESSNPTIQWMSKKDVLKMGIILTDGLGTKWTWNGTQIEYEISSGVKGQI